MTHIPLWTLIPAVSAVLLALLLLFLARRQQWFDSESISSIHSFEPTLTSESRKEKFRQFTSTHRWEILLAMVVLGLAIFAIVSAPVPLTGSIPAQPNMPGRPFYFIHWQRNHLSLFYNQTASVSNLLTGLAALAMAIFAAVRRSPRKTQTAFLWGCMSLAGSAQWMVADDKERAVGVAVYLMAAAGFLVWGLINLETLNNDIEEPHPIPFYWEATLVVIILALAIFGRMYALTKIPYGIEGDEAKWTAEVVSLGLRGDPDTNGMYHRDSLPVSFFMQTVFQKIMGPSLFAARFEVAFFSVIATLIFYLLLRQITTLPLALLSTWLLSGSIFDISASRLANVESHVKLWPILALALFAWALHKKHWTPYVISGIALALGVLTYDTVLPMVLVMIILVLVESRRRSEKLADTMRNLMALLTPTLLTLPFLIPYLTGRLSYYDIGEKAQATTTLWTHFSHIFFSWFVHPYEDFLYNRNGPLINAFLLPWMTFGFASALNTIRRRLSFWTLCWALLFIFPVPIVTHTPLGRVYYPALPAAYILTALGMYVFTRESLRGLGDDLKPLVTAISVAVLFWLPLFNLYIYFNEVYDFSDRQMRREIAEFAGDAASPDNLIVLASVPQANEPLNNEYQMIELFMLGNLPIKEISSSYKNVPLEEVLPTLYEISPRPNRTIILDKSTPNDRQKRDDLTKALHTCYPNGVWTEGKFFDKVDLNIEALTNPTCISANISLNQESTNTFAWKLSHGTASQVRLQCDMLGSERNRLEAEGLALPIGWQVETSYATEWSGNGFIMDNYGSVPMVFNISNEGTGPLYFWVRYYKRAVDHSPAELTLDGKTRTFSDVNQEKINQWVWEKVGPFDPTIGQVNVTVSRPYKDEPAKFIALFIDTIVYTHDPDFTPSNEQFQTLPVRIFNYQAERQQGTLTAEFATGSYRCYAEAVNLQNNMVDAFGLSPVKSGIIEFTVK